MPLPLIGRGRKVVAVELRLVTDDSVRAGSPRDVEGPARCGTVWPGELVDLETWRSGNLGIRSRHLH